VRAGARAPVAEGCPRRPLQRRRVHQVREPLVAVDGAPAGSTTGLRRKTPAAC